MRSKLFVPGSRPEWFAKAFAGAADAISLDLEDAVLPARKAEARAAVAAWLDTLAADPTQAAGKRVIVRVNAEDTEWLLDDIDSVVRPGVDVINLPKPDGPEGVRRVAERIRQRAAATGMAQAPGLLLNIETARGLRTAAELALADPLVEGLQLGLGDLFEPAGIARREVSAIAQAMFQLRLAASEAGIYAYDGAFGNVRDADGYRAEAELARRLGLLGKTCIHPSQVEIANAVFQPSAEEVAQAQRIVDAALAAEQAGAGACLVDGRMVDAPFLKRAQAVLRLAETTPA